MDSIQKYLAIILGTVFAIFVLLYSIPWKRKLKAKKTEAPEPVGAWPFIGHLPMLFEPRIPHIVLGALADKYGPAFTIRLGVHKALVVSSWEVAKECFTTNDKIFANRPSSVAVKIMGYNYALFGFGPYGSYWRETRKIAMLKLLSIQRLQSLEHVRISEVNTSIKELHQLWQENLNYADGFVPLEMKQWFGDLTLNIVVRMVVGKRFFLPSVNLDDDDGSRIKKGIKDFFHLVGLFVVSDALPCLGWLDLQGHEKAMRATAKELDSILGRWLEEHKQNKKDGEMKSEQDFMDEMLSILQDKMLLDYEVDIVNKAMCLNMILGGTDTTMVTLTWALSLLLNNRQTLKKAQDEIDTHIGKERHVHEADIEKLVYLQAIVKETLRLYPAAPMSGLHVAMEDCTVAGYHVPVGTRLLTNLWKIQRDPRIWSNPCEFHPERFLSTHANLDVRGQHFELIPFGSGRRMCPGISFGLQVVHLTLARFLQSFDIKSPMDASVDMTESSGLTNRKATPLQVLIAPRLQANLY
ncbi:hypothetical protein IFM89_011910 [Coptis chinensis]|uniref:Cytochrome P450 n=1 Tax=Coptis chinensis TaxID=261450 RepID=A0A835LXP9_9MAGN|nr:hypothetical protein IFM89_011910 [Coptis chinensis]